MTKRFSADVVAEMRQAEAVRIEKVRAMGITPEGCGPAMVDCAPARGTVRRFVPYELYPDGRDGWKRHPSGYRGRCALHRADVFDVMCEQARRAGAREMPFEPNQINDGRRYRDLAERVASSGVRCSSVEAMRGSGGDGGWIDAVIRDGRQLEAARRRIGEGVSMQVRRVRPSERGTRTQISDRQLVDMVCIADRPLSHVLRAFGWSVSSKNLDAVRRALCDALDRLHGCLG